jgi:DNA-binding SARP family transcriptional activator
MHTIISGKDTVAAAARAELHIALLGTPLIQHIGRTISIPRRQARALLYRLAARPEPCSRGELCFLFWPDIPEVKARRNLSRMLAHLGRELPNVTRPVSEEDCVSLDPATTWVDTAEFTHSLQRWTGCQQTAHLRQATELYRGAFLSGFTLPGCPEFEAWVVLERATWQRKYLDTLSRLIESYRVQGNHSEAIACAQRYLAEDDLAEEVHRDLIELYASAGQRSAALRQYETCVTILERELGVSPLPVTQAAYQAALEGKPETITVPTVNRNQTESLGLDIPLIGREPVMEQLTQAFAKVVEQEQGWFVLIAGEPGVGKSRLLQALMISWQRQALILSGAGYADTQTMPYQPVIEALRPALMSGSLNLSEQHIPWLVEASRLMPELRGSYPGLPPAAPAPYGRGQAWLFESLTQLLLGLVANHRAAVLCLDDLQWADRATLDWLTYLGRSIQRSRLLVIAAYRGEDAQSIAEIRHTLARQGSLTELVLRGLNEADVDQILQRMGCLPADSLVLAQRLWQVTGGNPFFLLETLRVLLESGQRLEECVGLDDIPLPDTVREAVAARVTRLTPAARQILEAGAVLGQGFEFETVRLTAGRQEMETIDGLDELVARQLLCEQATGFSFCHALVQEATYNLLSYWRKKVLHRRAAQSLEKTRPDQAAALAWHFEQAEVLERAAHYALQAGQAAKAVFAHLEGRASFERALALLEREAVGLRQRKALARNYQKRIQALHGRGWALRLLGQMEAYAQDLQKMGRLAEWLGDEKTLAHLCWQEAYTHRWFCRYGEAQTAAEKGLQLAQAAGDRFLQAACYRELGQAARARGDYTRSRQALEEALAGFIAVQDVVFEVHTLGNLSTLCWYCGEYEQAVSLARRALELCTEAGLELDRRLPLGDLGAAAAALGDDDLARQCLLESLTIARQVADRTQEILCLGHLGWLSIQERRPGEALARLGEALSLAENIHSLTEQSWLHAGLAEAYRSGGDLQRARAHAHQALELAQACGRAFDLDLAGRILAELSQ